MKDTIGQSSLWIYSTVFLMPFNGGYINAVCLVSILKNSGGYVTGNLTLAGESLAKGNVTIFFQLVVLVFCFLLGSIISGLIIKGQHFKMDHRYHASLLLQLATVVLAMGLLLGHLREASYFLALSMGLQNAMTSHYGSALIRTTHMTGTTTDLGILISRWLKGEAVEFWKMRLYAYLIIAFATGAIMGALIYAPLHAFALFVSVGIYLVMLWLTKWSSN